MKCPNCRKVELVERKVKDRDMKVAYCPTCKGMWFRHGQMEAILPEAVNDLPVPGDAVLGARSCPDCGVSMFQFDYPRTMVKVDMCRTCRGLWIDAGEAREISLVRRAETKQGKQDIPGGKGRIIGIINEVLDWAMHI